MTNKQHRSHRTLPAMALLLVCMLLGLPITAQTQYSLINTATTKSSSLSVDNFGNFYAVGDYQITKYDRDGKQLQRYEEVKYGKIGSFDISNPMKLTVYYPDFMTAVVLDRFLTIVTTYSFFDLGYQNVTAAGTASDGQLWFYDNISFTLRKIDETAKIRLQSQPVNQLIDKVITPNFLMERNTQVYVNDPTVGILVFDNFGAYYKTIPIKGLRKFQVLQEQIVYFEEGKLKSYNPTTFEAKMITLPDTSDVLQSVIEKERIAILKKDHVDFYKY